MTEKKRKYDAVPAPDPRVNRLTLSMSHEDMDRLNRLAAMLSPFVTLSQGKTVSAALQLAEEKLKEKAK